MDQQSTPTDITVNVEGFWMLLALLEIRHVAPELRCRPVLARRAQHWVSAVRVGSDSVVLYRRPSGSLHPLDYRIEIQAKCSRFTDRQHTWSRYGPRQRNRVNNWVGIKLAGCLAPDAKPTDCRDVAVLGETERDRLNRLGKENIGAARWNRAMLGWYHDQPRQTNLCGPRDFQVGSSTRGLCEVVGSAAIAVLGGHRRPDTSSVGR
jgi:hypothetical protein